MAWKIIRWLICPTRSWSGAPCVLACAAPRTGTFVVATLSIYELLHQLGPFWAGKGHDHTSLMLIGCYIGVVAVGNLLLSAAAAEREDALRATVESERRYRGVVEDQTDLICRFKPDGTLVFVNQAYCRFHGRAAGETDRVQFF